MKGWIVFISALVVPFFNSAQRLAHLSKSVIQIGQSVELSYELPLVKGHELPTVAPFVGTIPCVLIDLKTQNSTQKRVDLEILGKFTSQQVAGKSPRWIGKYSITAWDTGLIQIPEFSILYADSVWKFEPVNLAVSAPPAIAGQALIETDIPFSDFPFSPIDWLRENVGWLLLGVGGILVVLFWKFRKRKYPEKAELSLLEKTLLAIESLEKTKRWENEDVKKHYIELTYILKAYLGARYGLNLLEKTTFQTTSLLIASGLPNELVTSIQQFLEQADLVKFAKSRPQSTEIVEVNAWAKRIVLQTSEIREKDV